MTLTPGTRLGHYEIFALLGVGGMGEVYCATDTNLKRQVAIKVLPASVAGDAERLARFQREAEILAALNHPNIAHVHGLEKTAGTIALVMELVVGPTLADRIAKGPIPIGEALPIAKQIVDALEAAHEQGIIHRDLKPANIKVRPDGTVKVLDFGLAKARDPIGLSTDATNLPTITSPAMTQAGIILGTAAYMSPEQARGQMADKRADIWAFGCVLYEMLTGRRAFGGDTTSDVLARVIERDPDWSVLPPSLPEPVRRLLERTLRKDRRRRLSDIADARIEIDDALAAPVVHDRPAVVTRNTGRTIVWSAAVLVLTLALAGAGFFLLRSTPALSPVRLSATIPRGTTFQVRGGALGAPAGNSGSISPDGKKLIFTLEDASGKWQIWIRTLDGAAAQPLPGTDQANSPFWSPDNRYVGFFAEGKMKKIDLMTGAVTTICDARAGRGAAWNRDNIIVFAPSNAEGLYKVSSSGGSLKAATTLRPGETWHRSPSFLPDGRHFLYRVNGVASGIFLGSLDALDGVKIIDADTNAVYAPPGYVLFARQATLLAQPFDLDAFRPAGEPVAVAEDVFSDLSNGLSAFSVSDNGVLTYRKGGVRSVNFEMAWIGRDEKLIESVGAVAPLRGLNLSPDGTRVAIHRHDGEGGDLWMLERARGTLTRFTFDAAQDNSEPLWSHDGKRITYSSIRAGKWGLYQKPSNGSGAEEQLLDSDIPVAPAGWSRDESALVFEAVNPETGSDLMLLPRGSRKPVPLVRTKFGETNAQVSPDGKWLAYQSNESGNPEIYVDAFPEGGAKLKVSTDGGIFPRWRGDSRELFYAVETPNSLKMLAAALKVSGSTVEAGSPVALFEFPYLVVTHRVPYRPYAVSADAQRFLVSRLTALEVGTAVEVVLNWNEDLKQRVSTK